MQEWLDHNFTTHIVGRDPSLPTHGALELGRLEEPLSQSRIAHHLVAAGSRGGVSENLPAEWAPQLSWNRLHVQCGKRRGSTTNEIQR
jgi:hypothetical protein